jgi:hypothetical protein
MTRRAAVRLPLGVLLLLSVLYIVAGFVGRAPWKGADMAPFTLMMDVAQGLSQLVQSVWGGKWTGFELLNWERELFEQSPIPYGLGALSIWSLGSWMGPELASRLPFMLMLGACFMACYGTAYRLACLPMAQPLRLVFGGQAHTPAYARTVGSTSLLAFLACLGLMQRGHETTAALAQMSGAALSLWASTRLLDSRLSLPNRLSIWFTALLFWSGSGGLPTALAWSWGCGFLWARHRGYFAWASIPKGRFLLASLLLVLAVLTVWMPTGRFPHGTGPFFKEMLSLLAWFTWPAGPLAMGAVWSWRRHGVWPWSASPNMAMHIVLPWWGVLIVLVGLCTSTDAPHHLLMVLPFLAVLAAFGLPTWARSVRSLMDWCSLFFFSAAVIYVLVLGLSLETAWPIDPARNLHRLLPGFVEEQRSINEMLGIWALVFFIVGIWVYAVRWRAIRYQEALWKSLVLPATGTTVCWVLGMSLCLAPLNFARSYRPLLAQVNQVLRNASASQTATLSDSCIHTWGLDPDQEAALKTHGHWTLRPGFEKTGRKECPWLITDGTALPTEQATQWRLIQTLRRPSDDNEDWWVFERKLSNR